MSLQDFGYKEQLHRALSLKDLIIYGMIFMVPIAPYSVFGFVWNDAKGMVPLAYLIGLVGMFFWMLLVFLLPKLFGAGFLRGRFNYPTSLSYRTTVNERRARVLVHIPVKADWNATMQTELR